MNIEDMQCAAEDEVFAEWYGDYEERYELSEGVKFLVCRACRQVECCEDEDDLRDMTSGSGLGDVKLDDWNYEVKPFDDSDSEMVWCACPAREEVTLYSPVCMGISSYGWAHFMSEEEAEREVQQDRDEALDRWQGTFEFGEAVNTRLKQMLGEANRDFALWTEAERPALYGYLG